MTLPQRPFGKLGLVSTQGLGCMGLSWAYASAMVGTDEEKETFLRGALDAGVTLFNTANIYTGPSGSNEELIGRAFGGRPRASFFITTKGGIELPAFKPNLAGDAMSGHVEAALARLKMDYIDVFVLCRMDKSVQIEETMTALSVLVKEGKLRGIGLSECSAAQLRRAHAVHPVTAVEMEYSLLSRGIEQDILPTCRELGVAVLAYSPICRGLLSGKLSADEVSKPGPYMGKDFRAVAPRFEGDAFAANQAIASKVAELAAAKGVTAAQMSLAWVHAQGEDIFPIPGTTKLERLTENLAAASITLTAEEKAALEAACSGVVGDRYNAHAMGMCHENQ